MPRKSRSPLPDHDIACTYAEDKKRLIAEAATWKKAADLLEEENQRLKGEKNDLMDDVESLRKGFRDDASHFYAKIQTLKDELEGLKVHGTLTIEPSEEIEKLQSQVAMLRDALETWGTLSCHHSCAKCFGEHMKAQANARQALTLTADQAYEKYKAMEEVVEAARRAEINWRNDVFYKAIYKLDAIEKESK